MNQKFDGTKEGLMMLFGQGVPICYFPSIVFNCKTVYYSISRYLNIPNIEPMDTRQSMLDDPSRGSKHTTYLPRFSVSI